MVRYRNKGDRHSSFRTETVALPAPVQNDPRESWGAVEGALGAGIGGYARAGEGRQGQLGARVPSSSGLLCLRCRPLCMVTVVTPYPYSCPLGRRNCERGGQAVSFLQSQVEVHHFDSYPVSQNQVLCPRPAVGKAENVVTARWPCTHQDSDLCWGVLLLTGRREKGV